MDLRYFLEMLCGILLEIVRFGMLECLKITGKNPTRFWIFHWGEAGDSEILQVASWHIGHGG